MLIPVESAVPLAPPVCTAVKLMSVGTTVVLLKNVPSQIYVPSEIALFAAGADEGPTVMIFEVVTITSLSFILLGMPSISLSS